MQRGDRSSSPTRRRYDASGRQAEAEARRRRVASEARTLFLERGYAATSIADVADAAGVSSQMIYAAFGSKAGILARIVDVTAGGDEEDVLLRDRPEIRAALATSDPARRLAGMARTTAALNERVGPILHLVDSVSAADEAVGALRQRLERAMRADAREVARASLRDLRPELTIEEVGDVLGTVAGHRTWHALVVEAGWDQERYAQWLEDALVRLLT